MAPQFVVFAGAVGVNNLRKELLTYSTLTRNQHRQIGRGYAQGYLQCTFHTAAVANDAESLFYRKCIHLF